MLENGWQVDPFRRRDDPLIANAAAGDAGNGIRRRSWTTFRRENGMVLYTVLENHPHSQH